MESKRALFEKGEGQSDLLARKACAAMLFLAGTVFGVCVASFDLPLQLGIVSTKPAAEPPSPTLDFAFQMVNVPTTRHENKMLNLFVKVRYSSDPDAFLSKDYEKAARSFLQKTLQPSADLGANAEWERVNTALCQGIWKMWSPTISDLSIQLQVNGAGDGEVDGGHGQPVAPSTTCTMSATAWPKPVFGALDHYNRLPSR